MEYKCEGVYRDCPSSITRLAQMLKDTYNGRLKKQEYRAMAIVISMTSEGEIMGYWGALTWKHEIGQYENRDVIFHW